MHDQSVSVGASLSLSDAQVAEFDEIGAILVKGALSSDWIESLRAIVEDLKTAGIVMGEGRASTIVRDDNWVESEEFRRFLDNAPIARLAGQAMRSDSARIYEDLLLYRQAGALGGSPWHQDETLWPVAGAQMASVWLSLESVTTATGAMQFVAGSHKGPLYWPQVPPHLEEDALVDRPLFTGGPLPDIDAERETTRIVALETEPGDVIIFHPRTIHGTAGSSPDRPRRTFTIRFLGDDVRWQPKRTLYHDWLRQMTLPQGATLDHPRFPVIWAADSIAA